MSPPDFALRPSGRALSREANQFGVLLITNYGVENGDVTYELYKAIKHREFAGEALSEKLMVIASRSYDDKRIERSGNNDLLLSAGSIGCSSIVLDPSLDAEEAKRAKRRMTTAERKAEDRFLEHCDRLDSISKIKENGETSIA